MKNAVSALPLPRKIALAVVGAAGALALAYYLRTPPHRPTHALDAVPADAFVAIEIDVGSLRKAGALTALFGDRDEQSITKACGFDPVDRMSHLVFTVPEGATGDFGVAVDASLTREELVSCADAVVKARGGDPTAETVERGSYAVITPKTTSSETSRPARSLGYAKDGPLLVGPRTWVYTMIDTLEDASQAPPSRSPGEHVTLRQRLAAEITPTPLFLVTATALLDRSVRDKLKAEMIKEVGTATDSGTSMMMGVLGMTSGVLGLYEEGGDVHAVLDLDCEREPECAEVEKLVRKVAGEWSQMKELRGFGLGPVLDKVVAEHRGTRLQVRTSAPAADVVHWAKLFLETKTLVAPRGPVAAGSPEDDLKADVPTQTVRVTVPEGTKPGDSLTIKVPTIGSGQAGQVHIVTAVPAASVSAASPASAASGRALTVTVPGPAPRAP
jgi:hypothetical protein